MKTRQNPFLLAYLSVKFLLPFFLLSPFFCASKAIELPKVDYQVEYDAKASPPQWKVSMTITGLNPSASSVELELPDWGEWTEVDSYYLCSLKGSPPVKRKTETGNRFIVDISKRWNGSLKVQYALICSIRGSNAHRRKGILPFSSPTYSFGFTRNTLMCIHLDDVRLDTKRKLTLKAPSGWTVATGIGGFSSTRQSFHIPEEETNSIIAFGKPKAVSRLKTNGVPVETIQFGRGKAMAKEVGRIGKVFLDAYSRNTGKPLGKALRIFVNDAAEGGAGSDFGIHVGFGDAPDPGQLQSPYKIQFIGHELFHHWLGGFLLAAGKPLVWFHEGFTDYLSIWHSVSTGLVPPQWFADRIVEINGKAEANPANREVSFADPDTPWRTHPYEDFAYKGGAILAFHLDWALRQKGHPGLVLLIRDLLKENNGIYTLDSIRGWLEKNGLSDFYENHIRQKKRMDLSKTLEGIGFASGRIAKKLTYFGIQSENGTKAGKVLGVDPEGPAAQKGIRPGDYITGYYPACGDPVQIDTSVNTIYRFGLTEFQVGKKGTFLGIRRGEKDLKVFVDPALMDGGYVPGFSPDKEKVALFFKPPR